MKARNLFVTAALLLGFTGAAFSQATITTGTQARVAEEHKYGAQLGDIALTVDSGTSVTGSVTLQFFDGSGNPVNLVGGGEMLNDTGFCDPATSVSITVIAGSNTATIQNLNAGATNGDGCRVSGLRIDLRGVAAGSSVTVNFSATGNTITAGQTTALVVSRVNNTLSLGDINPATLVNTGGVSASATVELVEGVLDGWTSAAQEQAFGPVTAVGQSIDVMIKNLPDGAELDLSFASVPAGMTASIVVGNSVTTFTGTETVTITGTGSDLSHTIRFEATSLGAFETIVPSYIMDSAAADTPLSGGSVTATYAMGPNDDDGAASPTDVPSFDQTVWTFDAVIITIAEADCTILMNHVTVTGGGVTGGGVDTGISMANTSAFGGVQALTGPVTFWFYNTDLSSGGALPVVGPYTTSSGSPGVGLVNGEVEAGSNYVVLASELWDAAGGSGDFTGHVFATGDFLYCHGFNFISDFATFSQSYIPEVIGTSPRVTASAPTPESAGQ